MTQLDTKMQAAFLSALKQRANAHRKIVLPTGEVDSVELARVLRAIEKLEPTRSETNKLR
jgi:hypothetical protein